MLSLRITSPNRNPVGEPSFSIKPFQTMKLKHGLPAYSQKRAEAATSAAKALAPNDDLRQTPSLVLLEPELPLLLQSCEKPPVPQELLPDPDPDPEPGTDPESPEPDPEPDPELGELLSLLWSLPGPALLPPGIVAAVTVGFATVPEAVVAPASMSRPVPRKLCKMVPLSLSTTVSLVALMLS